MSAVNRTAARQGDRRPLSQAVLHILLTLADGDRHGYAIKQEVERRTDGALRLGPGTLYEAIQRLEQDGLIAESDVRPAAGDDRAQRRYYRLTPDGLDALRGELEMLGRLVDEARTKRHLKKPRPA